MAGLLRSISFDLAMILYASCDITKKRKMSKRIYILVRSPKARVRKKNVLGFVLTTVYGFSSMKFFSTYNPRQGPLLNATKFGGVRYQVFLD